MNNMAYVNFKGLVKKVNIKPKGVREIVIEVDSDELKGQLENLAAMVDVIVQAELESQVISYNVTVNTSTREPLIDYKVGQDGIVHEVKNNKQLELEGMPKEKIETDEEEKEVEREAVEQFILNDMAPTYDDFPIEMLNMLKRRIDGESYIKLANELGTSSGKIVEIFDDYCKKIAPSAKKWWEWKNGDE